PDEPLIALEDDNVIRPRPSRQLHRPGAWLVLQRGLARSLNEDFHGLADSAQVVLQADRVLQPQQVVVATLLYFLRHVVPEHPVPLAARPRVVLEDEAVLEAGRAD